MRIAIKSAVSLSLGASIGLLGLQSLANAEPLKLRYASSAPPKTVWAMQTERLAKDVNELSKGTVQIDAFINSQLGSEQDTIAQIARGRIDMGGYSITAGALIVPELALLNLPFLFDNKAQQDCAFDQHLYKPIEAMFAKKGLQFMGYAHVGETNIIGTKPYTTPDLLKGVKARAQPTKLGPYLWTAFGANPNPLPVTEWAAAHQSGLVDVADAPMTFYVFAGLGKVAPVLTATRHLDHAGIIVMNKKIFDKLPESAQKALAGAAERSPASKQRAEVRGFEVKVAQMHLTKGGTIVELTPQQRKVWRDGMEASWTAAVKAMGGQSNQFWQQIQTAIKACSKT
ncbi:MAG: TRAP transporter substrate-binding protein DctP [Quisquiliibacterium sp.]